MKKSILLTITFSGMVFTSALAQTPVDTMNLSNKDTVSSATDEFKSVLQESFNNFDSAKSTNEKVAAANKLALIAKKYSTEWAAQYYAGFGLAVLSYIEKDEKTRDAYIDQADDLLVKAKELYKKDYDEMYVMGAMLASARLSVKPASRYKKYGDIFNENIEKAKSLNADNPRIYYLQGTSIYYTPKMFGGGAKKAQPYFEKAETLYQHETQHDIFKPFWGHQQNIEFLKKCNEENK